MSKFSQVMALTAGTGSDVEVRFDPCLWLHYKGKWGTIVTPSAQPWYWTAETPVSRSPCLRACAQWWPETHKWPPETDAEQETWKTL